MTCLLKTDPVGNACLILISARLALKLADESVDLFERELIQCDNFGLGAKRRRQDGPCLFLAVNLHDDPSGVLPVHAPPVGVRHVKVPTQTPTRHSTPRFNLWGIAALAQIRRHQLTASDFRERFVYPPSRDLRLNTTFASGCLFAWFGGSLDAT